MEYVTSRQKEIIAAFVYRHFKSKSYLLSAMVENFADISIQAMGKTTAARTCFHCDHGIAAPAGPAMADRKLRFRTASGR